MLLQFESLFERSALSFSASFVGRLRGSGDVKPPADSHPAKPAAASVPSGAPAQPAQPLAQLQQQQQQQQHAAPVDELQVKRVNVIAGESNPLCVCSCSVCSLAAEIRTTETAYVGHLKTLLEVWVRPLQDPQHKYAATPCEDRLRSEACAVQVFARCGG